ncbi:collagenase [Thalassotalea castellviae]|uniref:Collagenase n=1 Tax=Thalassotalea castellviae TaxID=3075612 RepID=A0ABU3A286_9GAMM|nr:collagenase [Thalassotalea sp. W431]MDT0604287.1 collagenase [Thalassotalea sp. W431]
MKIYLIVLLMLLAGCGGGDSNKTKQTKVSQSNTITIQDSYIEIKKGTTFSGKLTAKHNNNLPISFELVSAPNIGEFELSSTGEFTFSVNKFESKDQTKFTFNVVADSTLEQSASVEITLLAPDNIAPLAEQSQINISLDNVYVGNLIGTDIDGDTLSFELIDDVLIGSLTFNNTTGEFVYIAPRQTTELKTHFTYKVFDGLVWSEPSDVVINLLPNSSEISRFSYQLFGNSQDAMSGVFILPAAELNTDEVFSDNIVVLAEPRFGSFSYTNQQFTYQPNTTSIEELNVSDDRVIVSIIDSLGNTHLIKYEFKFADHAIVYNGNLTEPLAPSWQSDSDFPELLNDIFSGQDPFSSDFVHNEEKFNNAIKALDALALRDNITDERLYNLTYYIRAHIYYFGSEKLTDSQLNNLNTAGLRLTQMSGFYGLSESATKIHTGYTDTVYSLSRFDHKHELLTKFFDINLALINLYSRFDGQGDTYNLQTGIYNVFDLIDRTAYAFKFSENRDFVARYYNESLLTALTNFSQSNLVPINGDYYLLYNIYSLGYEFWLDDDAEWQTMLEQSMVSLTRAVIEHASAEDSKNIQIAFYGYYLSDAVGYHNPDLAINLCGNEYQDICYIVSEQEILPKVTSCNDFAELRFDDLTIDQQDSLCQSLITTSDTFHQVLATNYVSVEDDFNDAVYASIFNSSQDYGAYGYSLYQIPTDNGGFYLEGTPSQEDNIARLFVYQQGEEDAWWVWNWEHEFTHYLDGRYVKYGEFGHLSLDETTWWSEGLAEYIAWVDEFPRGNYVLTSTPEDKWPTIEEISTVNYNSSSDLIYIWSYTLHRFLVENHQELHQGFKQCLISGDIDCYREKTTTMYSLEASYKAWLQNLAQSLNSRAKRLIYSAKHYAEDSKHYRMHSQSQLKARNK